MLPRAEAAEKRRSSSQAMAKTGDCLPEEPSCRLFCNTGVVRHLRESAGIWNLIRAILEQIENNIF